MIAPPYCHSGNPSFLTNPDRFYLLENKHHAKPRAEIRGDNELFVSIGNNQYLTTRRPSVSLGGGGGGGPCYYLTRSGFTLLKKSHLSAIGQRAPGDRGVGTLEEMKEYISVVLHRGLIVVTEEGAIDAIRNLLLRAAR